MPESSSASCSIGMCGPAMLSELSWVNTSFFGRWRLKARSLDGQFVLNKLVHQKTRLCLFKTNFIHLSKFLFSNIKNSKKPNVTWPSIPSPNGLMLPSLILERVSVWSRGQNSRTPPPFATSSPSSSPCTLCSTHKTGLLQKRLKVVMTRYLPFSSIILTDA